MFQGGQEILINFPAMLATDAAALRSIGDEARALFGGIGQLIKGIGEFKPSGKKFKAECSARVRRIASRKRCLRCRPMGQEGCAVTPQIRFDMFQQQAEEHILPPLIRARCKAGGMGVMRSKARLRSVVTAPCATSRGATART